MVVCPLAPPTQDICAGLMTDPVTYPCWRSCSAISEKVLWSSRCTNVSASDAKDIESTLRHPGPVMHLSAQDSSVQLNDPIDPLHNPCPRRSSSQNTGPPLSSSSRGPRRPSRLGLSDRRASAPTPFSPATRAAKKTTTTLRLSFGCSRARAQRSCTSRAACPRPAPTPAPRSSSPERRSRKRLPWAAAPEGCQAVSRWAPTNETVPVPWPLYVTFRFALPGT
mmetsp:Transcript_80990/g.226443  ORF Transcript_80990/g.226443 Transcript_80990/m.226443 type:complete len:223 (+) Transcript_80990:755-1423(+)